MDIAIPPRVIAEAVRMGRTVMLVYVAATCGFGVLGCLLAALWIAVLPHVGPAGAPLVVAGALALIGVVTIAVLRQRDPIPPVVAPRQDDIATLIDAASALTRADKVPALLAALLAGFAAGARPK